MSQKESPMASGLGLGLGLGFIFQFCDIFLFWGSFSKILPKFQFYNEK
jgi:hypothetical protein